MDRTTATNANHMPMSTPMDLFVHELSDAYSAEQIIVNMLGVAQKAASEQQLVQGLKMHQQESQQHAQNLEKIFQMLGQQPHQVTCHAAEGLSQSLQEGVSMSQSPDVINGLVTAGGCKTEHLEIAGYTGLIKKAEALGQGQVIELLRQNLQSELKTLDKLERIGEQLDAKASQTMGGMMGQQGQSGSATMH